MDAHEIISLLKMNPLYHRRLTVIVSLLGLAPDIDTFIREYCAPDGWQTPYNGVDYREFVGMCEGYRDKGIKPNELPGVFFLRFGVAIEPPPSWRENNSTADVFSLDPSLGGSGGLVVRPGPSGKQETLYEALTGSCSMVTYYDGGENDYAIYHYGIISIIKFVQRCSPNQKARVLL